MESGKTMRLDDDLIASFKEFGAVLLPKVISEGWVKKLREGVEYNMSTPGIEPGLPRPQRGVLTTRRCGPCIVTGAATSATDYRILWQAAFLL